MGGSLSECFALFILQFAFFNEIKCTSLHLSCLIGGNRHNGCGPFSSNSAHSNIMNRARIIAYSHLSCKICGSSPGRLKLLGLDLEDVVLPGRHILCIAKKILQPPAQWCAAPRLSSLGAGFVRSTPAQARQAVRQGARDRIGPHDQHRSYHERRARIRSAKDEPLAYGIHQNAHQNNVRHALEGASHELAPEAAMEDHPVEIGRPAGPRVGQATSNAQDRRDQRLQNEAESTGAGETFGDVFEKRARKQVESPPIEGVTQRPWHRHCESEQRKAREDGGNLSTLH
jgi:hypothetical protein